MTDQTFAAPGAATTTTTDARAGFWIRFAAALIDSVLLGIVAGVLFAVLDATGYAIAIVLDLAYFTYCEGGARGQTIGKMACNIQVQSTDGGPIGHLRAFLRFIGRYISSIPILLGYFWMLWDPNKQTWHDKIANSVVVPAQR